MTPRRLSQDVETSATLLSMEDTMGLPVPRNNRSTRAFRLASVTMTVTILAVILLPLLFVFGAELGATGGAPIQAIFAQRALSVILDTTLLIAVAVFFATVVGVAFAWTNERTDGHLGRFGDLIPFVPLLLPPLVGTVGWIVLAAPGPGYINVGLRRLMELFGFAAPTTGPLNAYSGYGLVLLYTLYMVPLIYLTVGAAFRNLDPSLEEASRQCGAPLWRTLFRITLPSVRPAIATGALLAGVYGIALLSIPLLLAGRTNWEILSVVIVNLMKGQFPPATGEATAYGLVMVGIVGSLWYFRVRLSRLGTFSRMEGVVSRSSRVSLGRWRGLTRLLLGFYFFITIVAPLGALILVALQSFWSPSVQWNQLSLDNFAQIFLGARRHYRALLNSVMLGVIGATFVMLVASVLTYYSSNVGRLRGLAVRGAIKVPAAISNVVIAVALVAVFSGPPFGLHGTLTLLLIGYIVANMPYASLSAESALEQLGSQLVEASRVAGAGEWRTFRTVVLPLSRPGLLAGWIFVFVLMVGDVTMSVLLGSSQTPVIGFTMVDLFGGGTFPSLAAMGLVTSVISSVFVGGVFLIVRRGREKSKVPIDIKSVSTPVVPPT